MSEPSLHPCARCARVQRTCCQDTEIVLTVGDRARIGRAVGHDAFWERVVPQDPAILADDPLDPNWKGWTVAADNTRMQLRHVEDGRCTFLGPAGCVLAEEVRPVVCRLYPYAYTERGLQGSDPLYCPTEMLYHGQPKGMTMPKLLGMTPARAARWHALLYRELREGKECDAHDPT